MAIVKPRSNKRSSGGSYVSTVTTVVFVSVCVLGVWMLTSNSVISPQKTTTVRTATTDDSSERGPTNLPRKIPTDRTQSFEDNPGDLPSDAIKPDDDATAHTDPDPVQEPKVTAARAVEDNAENVNDSDAGKQEAEQKHEAMANSKQEQEQQQQMTASNAVVEENPHGLQGKVSADEELKQKAQEIQLSEESTMTHSQHTEEIITAMKNTEKEEKQKRRNDHQKGSDKEMKKGEENHITEEEEEKRMVNQREEEEESRKGSTGIPKESKDSKREWSTQANESVGQKERGGGPNGPKWELCNVTAGTDYIPCLDNEKAIAKLHGRNHYEHRERHCPEEAPMCLVPLPEGYKTQIPWPQSRDKIWFHNVPHKTLASVKGHQNWVKVSGEFLTFPGGGTQFIHGALHYIDFVQEAVPEIAWGKHTRVILDVGCGVASFGGYLFDRDVLAMSFAPKDEHEAQIQFALERGIPAISAVMGTQRLPFPSRVFDLVHCARCRVPWHIEGGKLLLELNRVLRPGGYFVWSATPVYQKLEEDVQIWKEMSTLTVAMCWELVTIKKDKLNKIGVAVYHKPESNDCYNERKKQEPPMCKVDDDPNAAWYVPLQACMHKVPVSETERGSQWPEEWPNRVQKPPYWLNKSQKGIYGKPAPDDFKADYEHWKTVVSKSYMSGLGINWSNVRNVMDMRAIYGGFAAALKDLKLWVLNVVNIDSPDTLPIIYERGLFGIYHDWCESFSTYPRTYDLLHADHLFSKLKTRCKIEPVIAEIDRIVRPGGKLIVRDDSITIGEIENLLKSMHWEVKYSKNHEGILSAEKSTWRPETYAAPS